MNKILKRSKHRGFVLITSLIFLVVMTLLAATAIRRSTLGEKLSNNMREQNLAFQAAEVALRFCQNDYETARTIPIISRGLDRMPDDWKNINNWLAGGLSTQLPANTVKNVAQQPRCLIEEWSMRRVSGGSSINAAAVHLFTARGVGATTNAVVVLQATIRDGSL